MVSQHDTLVCFRIPQVSRFLRHVPIVQARIEEIHESVAQGKLDIVRGLIEHKKFAYCRDQQGATPLHKAVLYNQTNIIGYFLEHFPSTLHARDHVSIQVPCSRRTRSQTIQVSVIV